jgi:tetratricopeptide (TPR) repeat protein
MESLDYIDSYFKGELDSTESGRFEEKIINDSSFAQEVADYLSFLQVVKDNSDDNKKKKFRELYDEQKTTGTKTIVRRMWPSIAVAALVAGVIFGLYLFTQPVSPKLLADNYIREQLQKLPVQMGKQDSMQVATDLYNDEKLTEALQQFQKMIEVNPSNTKAIENAGITSLRLQHYEKALDYFKQLEQVGLYANPSLLYQALTLMKRNDPGDVDNAKLLLHKIKDNDLQGKDRAEEWLKRF